MLLGAAAAMVARFGGMGRGPLRLAAGAWCAAVAGLVLLADAQRRNADTSLHDLLRTPVGHALVWRAVAIGAGRRRSHRGEARPPRPSPPGDARGGARRFRGAWACTSPQATRAPARGRTPLSVGVQWIHFAAAGIWLGGLAALLLGLRGAPSAAKAASVRRFSAVALAALVVLATTGLARAVEQLSAWGELFSTGYGRAVLVKVLLLAGIVGLGALNRRRSVPMAAESLAPLRRTSSVEIALAAVGARRGRRAGQPRRRPRRRGSSRPPGSTPRARTRSAPCA